MRRAAYRTGSVFPPCTPHACRQCTCSSPWLRQSREFCLAVRLMSGTDVRTSDNSHWARGPSPLHGTKQLPSKIAIIPEGAAGCTRTHQGSSKEQKGVTGSLAIYDDDTRQPPGSGRALKHSAGTLDLSYPIVPSCAAARLPPASGNTALSLTVKHKPDYWITYIIFFGLVDPHT